MFSLANLGDSSSSNSGITNRYPSSLARCLQTVEAARSKGHPRANSPENPALHLGHLGHLGHPRWKGAVNDDTPKTRRNTPPPNFPCRSAQWQAAQMTKANTKASSHRSNSADCPFLAIQYPNHPIPEILSTPK